MGIPDRWQQYSSIGTQIEGTRFIAFKVPLDNRKAPIQSDEGTDGEINDILNTQIIFERIPNLGLVIDLTNTKKYYNPKNVTDKGIEYKKIFVPGQKLPGMHIYNEFTSTVTDFLRRNAENGKLIGVHCTHGLNRTGLMICAYMIQACNIPPNDAIYRFETARGHKMERGNYLESLRNMKGKVAQVRSGSSNPRRHSDRMPNYSNCPPSYSNSRPSYSNTRPNFLSIPTFFANNSRYPPNPAATFYANNANYRPNPSGAYFPNNSNSRQFYSGSSTYRPHPYGTSGTSSSSNHRYPTNPVNSRNSNYNRPPFPYQGNCFKD